MSKSATERLKELEENGTPIPVAIYEIIEQARQEEREKQPMKMIKALKRQFEAGEGSECTKWEEKIRGRLKGLHATVKEVIDREASGYNNGKINSMRFEIIFLESLLPPKEREQPEYHGVNSMKGVPPKAEK